MIRTEVNALPTGRGETIPAGWRKHVKGGLALLLTLFTQGQAPALGKPAQIWFAPLDPYVRPEVGYGGSSDYMALFQPGPGETILSRIDVFKVYAQFVKWAKDDDLRLVLAELKRHHIAFAMEGGMLTATEWCGRGVEGYGGDDAVRFTLRVHQLGGELAYIAMDEPAFYGHHFSGNNACQADIADVARNAAANIAAIKLIFPNIRIGDTEPVGPGGLMLEEYARWADAFRAATGEALAFSQADIQWRKAWRPPLEKFAEILRERGIPLGVIYNGYDDDTSDEAWVGHAQANYRAVEGDSGVAPDQAVLQSWVPHPTRLFPETEPGTFTHLLDRYLQPTSR